ncbi:winged helix-turn-helix domain-containing protein [Pseudoalteromonas luteoviolacea]|uniref:winged helix-turn-helix domain-containing protein n=1 Tax=Pseudoalteromonas luteoviolacea TaxID=43657 RepID=UPI001EEDB0B8|nr:winged helix-turn-helix domain-containing protein [Pseudoalteromonas luteoviolacea]MCF6441934.1 winged helix-turn-helix domain-containing protein [Pseudoalteromonas luteoviolacea]
MDRENTAIEHSTKKVDNEENKRFQFAHWQFFNDKDELWNTQTHTVSKLEPQVARLLTLLIIQQGQVLTKEMLNKQLWPNTIVEANSLYQLLTKLRKELQDSAKNPLYIKTVPKKGYLFLPEVSVISMSESEPVKRDSNITTQNQLAKTKLPLSSQIQSLLTKKRCWALTLSAGACFSAIAFFSSTPDDIVTPVYEREDITYALGVEFNVAAHIQYDLLAYIEQFNTLKITDKKGQYQQTRTFDTRIAHPTWHPEKKQLAYWQYQGDKCILHISDEHGDMIHSSEPMPCHVIRPPVWQSDNELVLTIIEKSEHSAYLYRVEQKQLVKIPLPKKANEKYVGAIRAWGEQIYYLIVDAEHNSRLVSLDGKVHLTWSFPIWLFNFDPEKKTIVSNDDSAHYNLIGKHRNGQTYPVFATSQGMFSNLSIDQSGDIYTAAETWQVNIRDQDDLPIFSSSSNDFLPVTNDLGETVFMSRRTGQCEIYLHSNNQLKQLSFNKGHELVSFLAWDPQLSKILSNRDKELVLYDREDVIISFDSQHNSMPRQFGWLDQQSIWSSDTQFVHTFNLDGSLLTKTKFASDFLIFDTEQQSWIVLQDDTLYLTSSLANFDAQKQSLTALPKNAIHMIKNPRLVNGELYWQSTWSKTDIIWKMPLSSPQMVTKIRQEPLIWHYDITPDGALRVAKMESVEADIRRIAPQPKDS